MLVTVHLNTENIHCHFVVNPVSFKDGSKFQNKIGDHKELRKISDAICQEHGLSVLESSNFYKHEKKAYWLHRQGKKTHRDTLREDVEYYLIPELLQLVDDGRIALTPAVELSYLPEKAQTYLLEEMRRNDCTPSLSQAIRMKKLYQTGSLSPEDISTIMQEEKANQQEKVSFKTGDLRKFFPKSYSAAQMQETILKLLSEYQRKRQRAAER